LKDEQKQEEIKHIQQEEKKEQLELEIISERRKNVRIEHLKHMLKY